MEPLHCSLFLFCRLLMAVFVVFVDAVVVFVVFVVGVVVGVVFVVGVVVGVVGVVGVVVAECSLESVWDKCLEKVGESLDEMVTGRMDGGMSREEDKKMDGGIDEKIDEEQF